MKPSGIFIFLSFIFLSSPAVFGVEDVQQSAALTSGESSSSRSSSKEDLFFVCNRAKDTRWLRAFKLDNGRCKTYYSKEGYVQVVSSASFFASCEAVLNTVKKNIEEGGFKCKEQQLASMVELE